MKRLFVLRPEPAASRTVERARALGLDAVAAPLFALEAVRWVAPDSRDFDALLLTSANAVNLAGDGLRDLLSLPVHAVGQATAVAAEAAGFGIASTGSNGVDDLLARLPTGLRLLHLCGEDRRAPDRPRQQISAIPVYRARPIGEVQLHGFDGAVACVHSPRAARRLAELIPEADRSKLCVAAISDAAAADAGTGWQAVRVAQSPTDEALLALAARLCET